MYIYAHVYMCEFHSMKSCGIAQSIAQCIAQVTSSCDIFTFNLFPFLPAGSRREGFYGQLARERCEKRNSAFALATSCEPGIGLGNWTFPCSSHW